MKNGCFPGELAQYKMAVCKTGIVDNFQKKQASHFVTGLFF